MNTVKKLDRCIGICNTLNDLSNKWCIPNKTEDLNLCIFNMITGTNESKTLTKHLWCICKNGRYLSSVMDDSVITCDEVIKSYYEKIKAIPTTFNEKDITCKTQNF